MADEKPHFRSTERRNQSNGSNLFSRYFNYSHLNSLWEVALVTNDKGILEAGDRFRKDFNGFDVMSISEATALAFDEVRNARKYAQLEPNDARYHNLPNWPPKS